MSRLKTFSEDGICAINEAFVHCQESDKLKLVGVYC